MKPLTDDLKWNIIISITTKVVGFKPELIDQLYNLMVTIRGGVSDTAANI